MRRILVALAVLLPLISLAHASSLICSTLGIGCTTNTTVNTTVATNVTTTIPHDSAVPANKSAGSVTLITSGNGQYNYQITLPKSLMNGSSIFSFYLLGNYNNGLGFLYPAKVTCTTTNQINCTAIFIVTLGSFTKLEVVRNGVWLYALYLPQNIVTKNTQVVTTVAKSTSSPYRYILYFFGIVGAVLFVGNVSYDAYRRMKNPNVYFEVNA